MRRDVFHAIADPTRRAIVSLLAFQALTPNAIATHFDTTRQAVSHHLNILAECELLQREKSGREIYYHLNPDKIKEVDTWLQQFRKLWETRFDQLDELFNQIKTQKNDDE